MKFLYIAFSAAYCGFIFWLSHQSEPPKPDLDLPLADKAVHFALFGGLAALVSLGMHYSARAGTRAHFFAPVLFALLYGVSDEVHQAFIPMRQPEVWDVVADRKSTRLNSSHYS